MGGYRREHDSDGRKAAFRRRVDGVIRVGTDFIARAIDGAGVREGVRHIADQQNLARAGDVIGLFISLTCHLRHHAVSVFYSLAAGRSLRWSRSTTAANRNL